MLAAKPKYCLDQLMEMLTHSPLRIIFQQREHSYSAKHCLAAIFEFQQHIPPFQQRVALCYENTYVFTIALLAVLASGLEPILLPNNKPGTLLSFAAEYDTVFTDILKLSEKCSHLPIEGKPVLFFDIHQFSKIMPSYSVMSKSTSHNAQQVITLFTSGSTGKPQKVSRTLKQLSCEIDVLERLFGACMSVAPVFSTVSHQHIYGLLFHVLWPLCSGRVIALPRLKYPEQIIEIIKSASSLVLISSPAMLKRMHQLSGRAEKITLFSSGGLLEREDANQVNECLGSYPIEVLGSTETGGIAFRQQQILATSSCCWHALPSVKLSLDPLTQRLMVRSPFFSEHDNNFMMGDVVNFNEDGGFDLLGRVDRVVKIEEKRISLTEIENMLKKNEWVEQAYTLKLKTHRQYTAAIIVLSLSGKKHLKQKGKMWLNTRLKTVLAEHIEHLFLPKKFRYVDEIPINSQGKYVVEDLKQLFRVMP